MEDERSTGVVLGWVADEIDVEDPNGFCDKAVPNENGEALVVCWTNPKGEGVLPAAVGNEPPKALPEPSVNGVVEAMDCCTTVSLDRTSTPSSVISPQ